VASKTADDLFDKRREVTLVSLLLAEPMPETDRPAPQDEDGHVLRDAINLLKDEVRLQKELMGAQNAQFLECRQRLEAQAEEAHRARQETALHREVIERQAQEAARQKAELERQAKALDQAYHDLGEARHELSEARRHLDTRFWRYTRPVRSLLGLFDPKG
jgi:chromosome segregation ATPase